MNPARTDPVLDPLVREARLFSRLRTGEVQAWSRNPMSRRSLQPQVRFSSGSHHSQLTQLGIICSRSGGRVSVGEREVRVTWMVVALGELNRRASGGRSHTSSRPTRARA